MPKRKLKLTAVTISEIPELIETIESSNLDITNKDKIVTNLMLVAHLADNLEYSRITIAKLRELFGIKAKVPSKEVTTERLNTFI